MTAELTVERNNAHESTRTKPARRRRDPGRDAGHRGHAGDHHDDPGADLPGGDRLGLGGAGAPAARRPAPPGRRHDPLRPRGGDGPVHPAARPGPEPGLLRVRRERVRRHPGRRQRRLHPLHRQGPGGPAVHRADVRADRNGRNSDRGSASRPIANPAGHDHQRLRRDHLLPPQRQPLSPRPAGRPRAPVGDRADDQQHRSYHRATAATCPPFNFQPIGPRRQRR